MGKREYLLRMGPGLKIDEVGYWTEIKLAILEQYAKPYNQILHAQGMTTAYIDGFAGAGHHRSKETGELIEGSPVRALKVQPAFNWLHFVDVNRARVEELRRISHSHPNVKVHRGDCNHVLLRDVFPTISYERYERALCILDPYGLHLDWHVIRAAGGSRVMDLFLNFPVMDMNMNVFWANPDRVSVASQRRMTRFWGDGSWKEAAYEPVPGLFGEMEEKSSIDRVVAAFQHRLKKDAGFKFVPKPIPMRNTKGAIVYFLFFAAQKAVAEDIVEYIFNKYREYGAAANG
jgi:three-Cys-motif partner protein